VDTPAGVGDALLREQGIERDEQVQIEAVEIHDVPVAQNPTSTRCTLAGSMAHRAQLPGSMAHRAQLAGSMDAIGTNDLPAR
jgi:hypothetical protein